MDEILPRCCSDHHHVLPRSGIRGARRKSAVLEEENCVIEKPHYNLAEAI